MIFDSYRISPVKEFEVSFYITYYKSYVDDIK